MDRIASPRGANAPADQARGGTVHDLPVVSRDGLRTDRIPYAHASLHEAMDKGLKAAQAQLTGGLSPIALAAAYADWALHLSSAPGKQLELVEKAAGKAWRLANTPPSAPTTPKRPKPASRPCPRTAVSPARTGKNGRST